MGVIDPLVIQQLTRLKMSWPDGMDTTACPLAEIRESFYCAGRRGNWVEDPLGQITEVPAAVRFMMSVRPYAPYRINGSREKIQIVISAPLVAWLRGLRRPR